MAAQQMQFREQTAMDEQDHDSSMSVDEDHSNPESQSPKPDRGRKDKGAQPGRVACGRCRRLKVKCRYKDEEASCLRCTSSKQECIEAVSQRKPKRKMDAKAAHYEETIRNLQETINQLQRERVSGSSASSIRPAILPFNQPFQSSASPLYTTTSNARAEVPIHLPVPKAGVQNTSPGLGLPSLPAYDGSVASQPPAQHENGLGATFSGQSVPASEANQGVSEFINNGLITQSQAQAFFDRARYGQIASYGALAIPEKISFADVRRCRPLVAMCAVAVGAQEDSKELYLELVSQCKRKILNEYYIQGSRKLDVLQAMLLANERFSFSAGAPHVSMTFALIAYELTLDLGMHTPTTRVREDAWDDLEYERTFMGVFMTLSCMMLASKRQPERVPWNSWHSTCKARLEASNKHDRICAKLTVVPRIGREIFECIDCLTPAIVRSFQQRIVEFQAELVDATHPMLQICTGMLTLTLHEGYIFGVRNPQEAGSDRTQLLLSMQHICNALENVIDTINRISNLAAYPAFFAFKPHSALVALAKVQRHLGINDGQVQHYAELVERGLFVPDGSAPRSHITALLIGKTKQIVHWYNTAAEVNATDSLFDILGMHKDPNQRNVTMQPQMCGADRTVYTPAPVQTSDRSSFASGQPSDRQPGSYLSPPISESAQLMIHQQGLYDGTAQPGSVLQPQLGASDQQQGAGSDFVPFNMMTGWPNNASTGAFNFTDQAATDLWYFSELNGMPIIGV
ncbi:hypothetical protein BCR37DRAFT_380737 [Protomyces lactucae-debilis]|uniref:Zn(2)-C6 fungal-type domain-containing protein n=1 Tax=Protomyces lactucae-debilis TaxID=2754530 RepID=A0A1Y2FBS0_PROLT|nr:uncharacterized protein BCR37DRAFT_380737 [Protomyces lactucae-debilis]ORY80884.1 hypothetical protein BCR37DRAFT_380737 [Protomyces lactucae-debilis]